MLSSDAAVSTILVSTKVLVCAAWVKVSVSNSAWASVSAPVRSTVIAEERPPSLALPAAVLTGSINSSSDRIKS